MADLPTKKVSVNIGDYQVTFEANSDNPTAGQVLSVSKNNVVLDPSSNEALNVVSDETTQTTLSNLLKAVNRDLFIQLGGE